MSTSVHAPEVTKDQSFYQLIKGLAQRDEVKTMLEIGSSTGLGSTQAFIEGITLRDDKTDVRLHCLEMFQPAFLELKSNTGAHSFIEYHNVNSIALSELPTWKEVQHFYHSQKTYLNSYTLETVKQWYDNGIRYAEQTGLTFNGIKKIKNEYEINAFDLVLIDGSEFTGEQDLYSVMGSKNIILDDCMTYKCYQAFQVLSHHVSYQLVTASLDERHGHAVFQRKF
jgi:hypothetical protein